jgi:flagellar basal body-associated protein FliL
MATAKPSSTVTTTDAPPKKKGKLLILVGIGVAVLALAGAGVFFFLNKPSSHDGEGAQEKTHASGKKAADHAPPNFYKFEKPFTVKLQTTDQEAYLQTEVQLKLLGPEVQETIKQYEPELKHRMTLALMGKTAPDLMTAQGVQRLANELRDVANDVINPQSQKKPATPGTEPAANAEPDALVQAVLFSTFIVQ